MILTPSKLRYKQLIFSLYLRYLKGSTEKTSHRQFNVQKREESETKIIEEMSGKKEDLKTGCSKLFNLGEKKKKKICFRWVESAVLWQEIFERVWQVSELFFFSLTRMS